MLKHLTFKKILAIRKKRKELSDDAILIKGILAWGESYLLKCSYIHRFEVSRYLEGVCFGRRTWIQKHSNFNFSGF